MRFFVIMDSVSVVVRRVNFLHVCYGRMAGGSDASNSIGMTGEVRKALRIRLCFEVSEACRFILSTRPLLQSSGWG